MTKKKQSFASKLRALQITEETENTENAAREFNHVKKNLEIEELENLFMSNLD